MVNNNIYLPLAELFTVNNKNLTLMKIFTQELCYEDIKLKTLIHSLIVITMETQ